MQVCFARPVYNHHGIVSNVWPVNNTYEIIHMTGDKDTIKDKQITGLAEIQKEIKDFAADGISFYDYGEQSLDRIVKGVLHIWKEDSMGSIVSKRARLLYEASKKFSHEVYYKLLSFNCEHFASYCATGLAFCKQKDRLALTVNTQATTLLDKRQVKFEFIILILDD